MSGDNDRSLEKELIQAVSGDLVICLDTGSLGIILNKKNDGMYVVSFPHGEHSYHFEDFDILKSGR